MGAVAPDYASVSAAVAGAARNATITVSAGSGTANWGANTLTLTKGISLQGPGRDALTITCTGTAIEIDPDSTVVANDETIRVEGFTFDAGGSGPPINVNSVGTTATKPFKNLVIGKNRIRNATDGVYTTGQNRGVIYSNIFDRVQTVFRALGRAANDLSEWNSGNFPRAYGSIDNLFFEGNTIQFSSAFTANFAGWTEAGHGGREVIRYNTWDYANATDGGTGSTLAAQDSHGFQGWPGTDGLPGTMITEFYGNTFLNSPSQPLSTFRGGWGMFHNNIISGSGHNYLLIEQMSDRNGSNGQCNDQIPMAPGVDGQVTNTYYFNNTLNGSINEGSAPPGFENNCGVAADVNWHVYTPSFNGSSGVGRGTTPPTPSSGGVAYWSNSVSALPTASPSTVQKGTLYISYGGSSWDHSYTPFTFPHPLTGGSPIGNNVFYVSPSGSDSNDGSLGSPWLTLTKASNTATNGDTVYIRSGSYTSYINPANSGLPGRPINFSAYTGETPTVHDAAYGVAIWGKSNIIVSGITFTNMDRMMMLETNASHNEISNCRFLHMKGAGASYAGSRIWMRSTSNWVHNCTFSEWGSCTGTPGSGTASGQVLEVGFDDGDSTTPGNYNLIENCTLFSAGHDVLGINGNHNIVRSNYIYSAAWTQGRGSRSIYLNGFPSYCNSNLFEWNRIGYSDPPCDTWASSGAQVSSSYNIFRRNCFFYNSMSGIAFTTTDNYHDGPSHNYVYNNSFIHNGWQLDNGSDDPQRGQIVFANFSTLYTITGNIIKNNLIYDGPRTYSAYVATLAAQTFANNYDGDALGDPKYVNATSTPGNPTNTAYPNMQVLPSSPTINYGGFLTTITSASGSGGSFNVSDANYFSDGWGITTGDTIQLQGQSITATITAVNYGTKVITFIPNLTWTNGQGVALSYLGSSPDAGAFETTPTNIPPAIVSNPTGVTNYIGSSISLTSVVSGSPTISYQWRLNTNAIGGANAATYTKANVTINDKGWYDMLAANSFGSVTSAPAYVSLSTNANVPPGLVGSGSTGAAASWNSLVLAPPVTVSGANRMLLYYGYTYDVAGDTVTNVTFNGSEQFIELAHTNYYDSFGDIHLWYLINPSVTTANVLVNGNFLDEVAGRVMLVTNVNQSSPFEAVSMSFVQNGSPVTSDSLTPTQTTNELVIDALVSSGALWSPSATLIGNINAPNGTFFCDSQAPGTSPATSMSWNGASDMISHIAVAIKPAAGAPVVPPGVKVVIHGKMSIRGKGSIR